MPSRWTYIFSAAVVAFLLRNGALCDDKPPTFPNNMMSLLTERINEQIYSLGSLQYTALGDSPIEVGIKVIMNALEIFTIASGTHLFIPKQWLDRETQITAIASANLCLNLTTMSEMYGAVVNATLFAGAELLLQPTYANKAPERLFEIIEQFANASSTLKDVYREEKTKVSQKPLPPVTEGTIDFKHIVPLQAAPTLFAMFNFYPRIRYFAVNALFALWTSEEFEHESTREYHALAKALIALSRVSTNPVRVQELFVEATERTFKELDPMKISFNTILQICETLASNIRKVFAEDPEINSELEVALSAKVSHDNNASNYH